MHTWLDDGVKGGCAVEEFFDRHVLVVCLLAVICVVAASSVLALLLLLWCHFLSCLTGFLSVVS